MAKLFSVIIACYKNSNLLTSCIDSILCQTYPAVEIIICEDCGGNFDADYFQKYIEEKKLNNIVRQIVYSNPENYGTFLYIEDGFLIIAKAAITAITANK